MKVVKINKKEYEVINAVGNPFTKFGKLRAAKERHGSIVQRCCFNCGHKFKDDEDIYLAMFKGTLNDFLCFLCKSCNDKALADLKKGGRQ